MNLSKDEIRKVLSVVPNLNYQGKLTFRYLAEGITNENYWISLDGSEYVLRINNPDSDRLGLDRDSEKTIMQDAASLNLVPESIFCSKKDDFRLSKWLPGDLWNKQKLEKPVNLNRLAQRLKQLHSMKSQKLPAIDLLKRLDLYRTMIQQRHGQLPAIEQRLLPLAISLLTNIRHSLPACLCHNDLLASNILDDGQIRFLDWEYAAVNDPIFELAVICRGNRLSDTSQQYLLQAYLGTQAGQFIGAFDSWSWFYEYLSLLWGLVLLPEDIALPESLSQLIQQLMDTLPNG